MINLLVIIKMRHTLKLIGLSLMMLLLAACGSEDTPSQALSVGTQSTAGGAGSVLIQKGPVANATVIVKTYEGQDAGKATTNADGQYKVDSGQPGQFIAEARDAAGKVYYSVGESANMNITELGDYLLRQWFQARGQDVGSIFAGGISAISLPNVQELNVLANQIVATPAYAMQKQSTELFGGEMTPTLAKILQGTVIESDTQLRVNVAEINFKGIYTLKSPQLKKGVVVFEGSEETSSDNVEQVKGPIAASVSSANPAGRVSTNSRLLRAASSPMVGAASGGSNEHWMKDNWDYIKDKKLVELVIPGTHDSGTNDLGVDGAGTARTQTKSIADQLKDGIRYFDLRAVESKHQDCADPSVWWITHGGIVDASSWTGGWTFYSYRIDRVLDEVKAFVSKPGNENEVVILDFQDTKIRYADERARNVLFGMIQDKLGAYLAKAELAKPGSGFEGFLKSWRWEPRTIEDLVANNKRVVVLLEHGQYERLKEGQLSPMGCYKKPIDFHSFSDRTKVMISLYDEDHAADAAEIGKYTVDAQLNLDSAKTNNLVGRFNSYRDAGGKLRVLQLVARPPNIWYASSESLLDYVVRQVNYPLNYIKDSKCQGGWLGKRLRMGLEGNPDVWNPPNIIIVDNYDNKGLSAGAYESQWVLPNYKNGKWVKDQAGGYVDMIISLNKIPKGGNRLTDVKDLQDGQCLN